MTKNRGGRNLDFDFLLLDGFSALSLITATETLRIASRFCQDPEIRWRCLSVDGRPVRSGQGTPVDVEGGLVEPGSPDGIAVVVGGNDIWQVSDARVVGWVRKRARHGAMVGGLCTAAVTLAKAGVLVDREASMHHEVRDAFLEVFLDHRLSCFPYTIDEDVFTSAGGTTAIDVMLEIISANASADISGRVAAEMLYGDLHIMQKTAHVDVASRNRQANHLVGRAIRHLEANLDRPVPSAELAQIFGVSVRQIERLFGKHVGVPPKLMHTKLRLERGYKLVMQTDLTVIEIAMACGYDSSATFAKNFARVYGASPHRLRGRGSSQVWAEAMARDED